MFMPETDQLFTSHEVGDLLQVNPSSVNKWISEGRIPAFRTPGGHRRIRAVDLIEFLRTHKMPIPVSLARSGRPRILVVDDDARHLRSVERSMRSFADSLEVELCDNGIDALIKVGEFKPQ